jgi:hypothetical protein
MLKQLKEQIQKLTKSLLLENQSVDEPTAALAFKIATDPYVGRLCFYRMYSGVLMLVLMFITHEHEERANFSYLPNALKQTKPNRFYRSWRYRCSLLDLKILEQEIRFVMKMHQSYWNQWISLIQ